MISIKKCLFVVKIFVFIDWNNKMILLPYSCFGYFFYGIPLKTIELKQ